MTNSLVRFFTLAIIVACLFSCQKEISGEPASEPVSSNCRVTEISSLNWGFMDEDSTMFSKLEYDSQNRLIAVSTPAGDTNRFHYYTDSVVLDTYITFDFGNGLKTTQWKDKYILNSNGLAKYALFYIEEPGGGYLQDSAVFTYDANGYLTLRTDHSSVPGEMVSVKFEYKDGNMVKASVLTGNHLYNQLDSMVVTYSSIDVPATNFQFAYWNRYTTPLEEFPWVGKQSKKMPAVAAYHFKWGKITETATYVTGSDDLPSTVRHNIVQTSQNGTDAWYWTNILKYSCK